MTREGQSPQSIPVVLLLGSFEPAQSWRRRCAQAGVPCVVVADAYSAAVEMLQAPRAALVVDPRALRRDQAGLLELARRRGLPVLGLGEASSWPGSAGQALPVVAADGLIDALRDAALQPPAPPETRTDEAVPQTRAGAPAEPGPSQPHKRAVIYRSTEEVLSPEEIAALLDQHP